MWFSAQDSALLHLLLNIVSFFISFRQKCVPFWYVLYHTGLYRLCTSFEGASWRGQPLNILSDSLGRAEYHFSHRFTRAGGGDGGRTNFVELCSVSRPRLAEMASGYGWCVNLRKNYSKPPWFDETSRFESLCRYSEIQVLFQSIFGSEVGTSPALSRKRGDILNIGQYSQNLVRE